MEVGRVSYPPSPPPISIRRPRGQTTPALPRLIDRKGIMDELGVTEATADRIMENVPKVHIPGLRKVFVKRDDVLRLIEEGTRAA